MFNWRKFRGAIRKINQRKRIGAKIRKTRDDGKHVPEIRQTVGVDKVYQNQFGWVAIRKWLKLPYAPGIFETLEVSLYFSNFKF